MEIRYCQMQTKDGYNECGFLCGSICRANPQKPFWVSGDFHDRIKTVGCQSWQRYLDYDERRKRYGNEAVSEERGTEGRTAGADRREVQVSELHIQSELESHITGGDCRQGRQDGCETPPSMRILQENRGNEIGRNPEVKQPPRQNLGTCNFCKEPAVTSDSGLLYCSEHAKKMGLK